MTAQEFMTVAAWLVEGKAEYYWDSSIGWGMFNYISPGDEFERWRKKPETKLRPWKPEEIPMTAWYRLIGSNGEWMTLAGISAYGSEARLSLGTGWLHAFTDLEHSTDNGKTWKPCGVEE